MTAKERTAALLKDHRKTAKDLKAAEGNINLLTQQAEEYKNLIKTFKGQTETVLAKMENLKASHNIDLDYIYSMFKNALIAIQLLRNQKGD